MNPIDELMTNIMSEAEINTREALAQISVAHARIEEVLSALKEMETQRDYWKRLYRESITKTSEVLQ